MKQLMTIALLTICFVQAKAQETTEGEKSTAINADLPDETEETDLLEKGQLQGEFAYLYTGFDKGVQPAIFQGLIRYGLFERLELRALIEDGRGRDRYIKETVQSTAPLALSAKVCLLKQHAVLPDITLVAYLKLPFTSRSSDQLPYWSPNTSLAFQHRLGEAWKLEYNFGAQQEVYSTHWAGFANASLHYRTKERVDVFAEYYGQYQKGEDPRHNAGAGLFIHAASKLGFYAVGGRSIEYQPANYFLSGGLVVRMP
jgi:hypothetical protein